MPQSKKVKRSRKTETPTPTQEEEHPDSDVSEPGSQATVDTFRRKDVKNFEFPDAEEKKLVDFFEANDCFYNKLSGKYANTQHKDRLLAEMASELDCDGEFHSLLVL